MPAVRAVVFALAFALIATPSFAQLQVAVVRGTVLDARGGAAAGADITLTDQADRTVASARSDAAGAFAIGDVVPGAYVVRVRIHGTLVPSRPLVVRGALPIELTLDTTTVLRIEDFRITRLKDVLMIEELKTDDWIED